MKKEIERLKLRQKYRNEVNPVLAEKHVPNDTYTFTDEYVFWLEEQLVKNIEVIPCCKSGSEQLDADFGTIVGKEAHFYKDGKIIKKEALKFSD